MKRLTAYGLRLVTLCFCVSVVSSVEAQEPPLWPGVKYDPAIPTLQQVIGHAPGEAITPPEQVAAYLQALQKAAPDADAPHRVRAHAGRARPLCSSSSAPPSASAALDAGQGRHAPPGGSAHARRRRGRAPGRGRCPCRGVADARRPRQRDLARPTPRCWRPITCSAAQATSASTRSCASRGADRSAAEPRRPRSLRVPRTGRRRRPMARRRARRRRARRAVAGRARQPLPVRHEPRLVRADAARDARPHRALPRSGSRRCSSTSTRWEATRPTTSRRPPSSTRTSPRSQTAAGSSTFGRANARRFDERGFDYFMREVYDSFYPGYGDSWPIFHGAIGMTYEQASARGLAFSRRDGDEAAHLPRRRGAPLHGRDHHGRTAARHRERLLRDFPGVPPHRDRRGRAGPHPRVGCSCRGADPSRAAPAGAQPASQGFEVRRADEPVKLATRTVPARRVPRVDIAQPTSRMARNLLDPSTEQRPSSSRSRSASPDGAWTTRSTTSPPGTCQLFDVEVVTSPAPITARATPVPPRRAPGRRGKWRRARWAT